MQSSSLSFLWFRAPLQARLHQVQVLWLPELPIEKIKQSTERRFVMKTFILCLLVAFVLGFAALEASDFVRQNMHFLPVKP